MQLSIEKVSNKRFKKRLITAKLQNKINQSKSVVLSNVVLNSTKVNSSVDLNKFSKNFINIFKNIVFKFPAKVSTYNDTAFLADFNNFGSIIVKNNNLLLKHITNKKLINNLVYFNTYKQLSNTINPFFYFSKFIS